MLRLMGIFTETWSVCLRRLPLRFFLNPPEITFWAVPQMLRTTSPPLGVKLFSRELLETTRKEKILLRYAKNRELFLCSQLTLRALRRLKPESLPVLSSLCA